MFGWKGLVKRILALEERRRHHGGPFLVAIHTPLKAFCLRHDLQKISFPYFPLLGIFTFGSLKIGKVQSAEVCNVWGWGEERPYCIFNCLRCNAHFPFLFYFRSTPTTESHFQLKILKVNWEVDVRNVLASAWCSSILSILQKHNCQNVQIYLFQNLQINFSKFTIVFVQIDKCICPNWQMYLSKLQNVFVQTSVLPKWVAVSWSAPCLAVVHLLCHIDIRQPLFLE